MESRLNLKEIKAIDSEVTLILDQLNAIVYVCDVESKQVLYINEYAKLIFGDVFSKTCWKSFQKDANGACLYCSNGYLTKSRNEDHIVIRDHFNSFNDKWYEVHDKLINWTNGKKVKLEVAYNIDHRKEDEKKLLSLYKQQELFSKIAISFNKDEPFANKVNMVLDLVGNFVSVSRVSIFENQEKDLHAKLIYEWCKNGINPKINKIPLISYSQEHPFYEQISDDDLFVASDLNDEIYKIPFAVFRKFNVRAMLLIPIYLHKKHTGFISFEVCNEIRIWQKDEVQLIRTFGNIISTAFERKTIEEKRIRVEHNLREANATKDKFFSIITNNLLSPFSDLTSLSSILLDNYSKWDDTKRIKFLQSIKESSKHGFKLLENLITWSKMQSGQMEFYQQKVDLRSAINLTLEQLKEKAESKNITIIGAPEEFIFVFADYMMLNTIFRNLILNSIIFSPSNETVSIQIIEKNEMLEISIVDNGIGIEKNYLHSLFRIDLDNRSFGPIEDKGTGLGLIICREFVEKHGGQIWAKSEIGKGSIFTFTIPRFVE